MADDNNHDKMNVSKSGDSYKATVTRTFKDEEAAHSWAETNMSTTGTNPMPNPTTLEESLQVPQVIGGELNPVPTSPDNDDADAAGIDVKGTPGDPNPDAEEEQGNAKPAQPSDSTTVDSTTRNNSSDKKTA